MSDFIKVKKGEDITSLMDITKVIKGTGILRIICNTKAIARTNPNGGIEVRPFTYNYGDIVVRVVGGGDDGFAEDWAIPGFTLTHLADGSLIKK